jgi:hypothetical protein
MKSCYRKAALVAAILMALGCPVAFAATINLSTGLNAGGNLITTDLGCDAHWTQVSGPTTACGDYAQVAMSGDADWGGGGWVPNGLNSNWITSDASNPRNGSPLPTYQVQFYLADTTNASLTGSWTIDDQGTISLNGNQIGVLGNGNWGAMSSVSAGAGSFVAGLNTLSITMTLSDNSLEGVRFDGSVTGDLVPEPASGLTLLTGLGAFLLFRRRR